MLNRNGPESGRQEPVGEYENKSGMDPDGVIEVSFLQMSALIWHMFNRLHHLDSLLIYRQIGMKLSTLSMKWD